MPKTACNEDLIVLPTPGDDSWSWQLRARCRDHDPTTFFGDDFERGSADSDHRADDTSQQAKAICNACPVRQSCLAHALDTQEPYGIWGGLTERERRQYKWFHYAPPTPE